MAGNRIEQLVAELLEADRLRWMSAPGTPVHEEATAAAESIRTRLSAPGIQWILDQDADACDLPTTSA